ncbi:hypothetical protein E3N88_17565 [Mikania micrantha]|uniref:Vacuolar cation/proton exchanger n=1 Tax=Mikania micrantha TaxID=192012 RepID=A0A5N6NTL3_9ASTR|nr:hypothetical protein E3N88_17565 [Mikania micrantha]
MSSSETDDLEIGEILTKAVSPEKMRESLLRRSMSDDHRFSSVSIRILRDFVANVRKVVFETKLFVLFPAIPMAFVARWFSFGRPWIFALSLIGLTPLAERLSFLTELFMKVYLMFAVGGLVNATCGNATELIIAMFALHKRKIHVLKYSLLGSIISNLLLVLGSSLLCGGIANLNKEQKFDHKQVDANMLLLLLGLLCQITPLLFNLNMDSPKHDVNAVLQLSRTSSIVMLIAYVAYLFFQLKTHSQLFESQEDNGDNDDDQELDKETASIGVWSAFIWLCLMTVLISVLSQYVLGTIEDASESWGLSVSFMSIILLPIVGNAAEHAGAVIFAFKNKLDISLGVALGSASQILMFVVPLCVIIGWIKGIQMNLDFGLLETGCLAFSIFLTAFTLQDGSSHYLKGVTLTLAYVVTGSCFFVQHVPFGNSITFTC